MISIKMALFDRFYLGWSRHLHATCVGSKNMLEVWNTIFLLLLSKHNGHFITTHHLLVSKLLRLLVFQNIRCYNSNNHYFGGFSSTKHMHHTNIISMHFWITFCHMYTIILLIKWTTSPIFRFVNWVCTRHFIWRSFLPYLLLWLFILPNVFILKLPCLSFTLHEDKRNIF